MSHRKGIYGLRSIAEHKDEDFLSKNWEDFDHSQKLGLGVWGSTWTIRDKKTSQKYVLQSCHQTHWTLPRFRLLELARRRTDLFVVPRFMFFRGETVYVCSDVAGICLAELIDSTIAMHEIQAAAIIKKLIPALQVVGENGIFYNVKASNVFLSENGHDDVVLRLGGFGRKLQPEFKAWDHISTCEVIAHLVYHMVTRIPEITLDDQVQPAEQMIVIRTRSISIPISAEHELSSSFFDFLEACLSSSASLESIATHMFLRKGSDIGLRSLLNHVRHTSVLGHRWETMGAM